MQNFLRVDAGAVWAHQCGPAVETNGNETSPGAPGKLHCSIVTSMPGNRV